MIVGGGPCGLAAAISAQRAGLSAIVVEAQVICSTIAQYPTYVRFFSTAEKLSLGGVPFVVATDKPTRRDALAYYRTICRHFRIPLRQYERVTHIDASARPFLVHSRTAAGLERQTRAHAIVVATGYFGSPNRINVPGEELSHVSHAYREGHEAFLQNVVVVGGGNSAAEAALDLWRSGASVTLVHFGPTFDKRIKPWVLPDLENRIREKRISARFAVEPIEITGSAVRFRRADGRTEDVPAERVWLLTGYGPDVDWLRRCGVPVGPGDVPEHDARTHETPRRGVYVAGVIAGGSVAGRVFIEDGRFHGDAVVRALAAG